MKYLIIGFSALIIEICSTFYIRFVSDANVLGMLFFAFIGPFLSLPFTGYMVDSDKWSERAYMALAMAIGYLIGSAIVITFIK